MLLLLGRARRCLQYLVYLALQVFELRHVLLNECVLRLSALGRLRVVGVPKAGVGQSLPGGATWRRAAGAGRAGRTLARREAIPVVAAPLVVHERGAHGAGLHSLKGWAFWTDGAAARGAGLRRTRGRNGDIAGAQSVRDVQCVQSMSWSWTAF